MSNREQGFTLIELLITLVLLAIAANIALPAFDGLIARSRQQTLMEQVESILNNARAEAVLRRRTIEICGSSNGQTCSANWVSGWLVRTSDNQILQLTQLPTHDDLRWSGFQQSIRYRDNGSSPTGNGRFYQCHKQQVAWQLILNRQGRLRHGTPAENSGSADLCSS
ncbi:general secretion pathway protein GspH [Stutzerimonas stutzeri]|uniref:Type II secretion system protein H n=1 Tax=Stutzerimonas stutzeri TaxID=316 RepID=W8RQH2_STUST|nr:GspH/FimT family pseudopilin [Stutzerimonas stutzeri]AHL74291.1 general secretion pathway protein GspH [Stutzerimonas stutzeri]MCQ4330780.1 GspH/FimT family pseudopilin [Stutzerimonas stutzeri]